MTEKTIDKFFEVATPFLQFYFVISVISVVAAILIIVAAFIHVYKELNKKEGFKDGENRRKRNHSDR